MSDTTTVNATNGTAAKPEATKPEASIKELLGKLGSEATAELKALVADARMDEADATARSKAKGERIHRLFFAWEGSSKDCWRVINHSLDNEGLDSRQSSRWLKVWTVCQILPDAESLPVSAVLALGKAARYDYTEKTAVFATGFDRKEMTALVRKVIKAKLGSEAIKARLEAIEAGNRDADDEQAIAAAKAKAKIKARRRMVEKALKEAKEKDIELVLRSSPKLLDKITRALTDANKKAE